MASRDLQLDGRGREILGKFTGPSYPFGPEVDTVLGPKLDVNVIVTSIYNIITTIKGSVPYAPELGSVVPTLLFELESTATHQAIYHFGKRDLQAQEPRIRVIAVRSERIAVGLIRVTVIFRILGDVTNRTYNAPITFTQAGV